MGNRDEEVVCLWCVNMDQPPMFILKFKHQEHTTANHEHKCK